MRFIWTHEKLQEEALKYTTRSQFQKNKKSAYNAALRLKIIDIICSHMPLKNTLRGEFHPKCKWSTERLQQEGLKYKTRVEFQNKASNYYQAAYKRNLLDLVCAHMRDSPTKPWTNHELQEEALKYKSRNGFAKGSPGAYKAALQRNVLDLISSHMKVSSSESIPERSIFDIIKSKYPKAQKLRIRTKRNACLIEGKPHIKGFDIDIYIPELRKGIEFNGNYWHSIEGLKRSREHWPEEDLTHYQKIKDEYFLKTHRIKILSIDEKEFKEDRDFWIRKCFEFLEDK